MQGGCSDSTVKSQDYSLIEMSVAGILENSLSQPLTPPPYEVTQMGVLLVQAHTVCL